MIETVIIGAGPYGLSIAAHLRGRGIPFRIFGRIMDSWRTHMPKGMCLKSDGFALYHLAHLVVHGSLHLQGHDHHGAGEARRMEMAESRILGRMGLPNPWKRA